MNDFTRSLLLLFVLLNPFIMSDYMQDLVRELDFRGFSNHRVRAALISLLVFLIFAWAGDVIFEDVLQVRFHSFQVFGGVTFLIIGIRLILGVGPAVVGVRPHPEQVSAAIAMPLIVGPGTISASVLAGIRLDPAAAALSITLAMGAAVGAILLFKLLHDFVRARNERLVRGYAEIAGRVTALFTGSFAIEMILVGIDGWLRAA